MTQIIRSQCSRIETAAEADCTPELMRPHTAYIMVVGRPIFTRYVWPGPPVRPPARPALPLNRIAIAQAAELVERTSVAYVTSVLGHVRALRLYCLRDVATAAAASSTVPQQSTYRPTYARRADATMQSVDRRRDDHGGQAARRPGPSPGRSV